MSAEELCGRVQFEALRFQVGDGPRAERLAVVDGIPGSVGGRVEQLPAGLLARRRCLFGRRRAGIPDSPPIWTGLRYLVQAEASGNS